MDNPKPTPESSHVLSREAAEAIHNPVEHLKKSMVAALGGAEKDAYYTEYPSNHMLQTINVERTGGKFEAGWTVVGEASNNDGDKIHMVGRLDDEDRFIAKPATPEQIIQWNTPETRSPQIIKEDLGRIAVKLGGNMQQDRTFEIIDAPVDQLPPETRFGQLLKAEDDGLTDQERIEAAAFDPRLDTEKEYDAMNAARRETDHKYNLARQTERMRDGGN